MSRYLGRARPHPFELFLSIRCGESEVALRSVGRVVEVISFARHHARNGMNEFQDIACRHFDFLCSRHGFRRTVTFPEHVRYESDKVFLEITNKDRDGICVDFGRFGQPGSFSEEQHERLSLHTFLSAIRTHRKTFHQEPFMGAVTPKITDRTLGELASGLSELGRGLLNGNENLYRLVRELRFWHVGEWTALWGTTIVLSNDELRRHRQLVPDILSLIEEDATQTSE